MKQSTPFYQYCFYKNEILMVFNNEFNFKDKEISNDYDL